MRVIITVRAEGTLARLAHDIRLEASGGSITSDGETVRARFPIIGLRVVATSRHGKDAFARPSAGDAREIEERVRTLALVGGDAIEIVATRERIEVIAPRGKQIVSPSRLDVRRENDRTIVRGSCALSLAALGTGKIRLPLGAVHLSDAIDVEFDVTLTSAGPTTT